MNEQTKKNPKEGLKQFNQKVKTFWGNQTKKRKITLISSIVAIIVISAVIVGVMNRTKYVVLYPSLDKDETIEVTNELKGQSVDFKEQDGKILIPSDKEESIRMQLANEGHPKSSPNYDFFIKNVNMMTTSEQRKIIEKYQLDQKLGSVIEQIDGIKDATVTITLPNKEGYVLSKDDKNEEKATAGVTVTMTQGKELSPTQVKGIKKLVASSVPNLNEKEVTVVDTATGLELSSDGNSQQKMDLAQFKFVVEKQFEADVSKNIQKVLEPLFGKNNVKVAVKSVIDIDKKIQEAITYTPSENNKGVLANEKTEMEQETKDPNVASGVPGTDTNTDEVTTYPGVVKDGNTLYIKDNKSYEYLVSSVKEQIQKESGDLKDLTVSVAVNKESLSQPRKEELASLVANAAAVDSDKVVIYADTFSTDDKPTSAGKAEKENLFKKYPWLIYAVIGAIVFILLTIIISSLIVKKRKKKQLAQGFPWEENYEDKNKKKRKFGKKGKEEEEEKPVEEVSQDTQQLDIEDIDLSDIKETKEQAMKREIVEFTTENPEITAQLIKTWLKGDD